MSVTSRAQLRPAASVLAARADALEAMLVFCLRSGDIVLRISRRLLRDGDRLHAARRFENRPARTARGESRHHSGLRREPEAAASRGEGPGARNASDGCTALDFLDSWRR